MSRPADGAAPSTVTCPSCTTVLPGDSVFCLQCGGRLPAAAPAAAPFAPSQRPPIPAISPSTLPGGAHDPAAPAPPEGPPRPQEAWADVTPVFGTPTGGAPAPVFAPTPSAAPPPNPLPSPSPPVGEAPRLPSAQRTMMGLQRDELAARAALAQAAAPPSSSPPDEAPTAPVLVAPPGVDPVPLRPRSGTMMGVAAPVPGSTGAAFPPTTVGYPGQAQRSPAEPGFAPPPRREAPPILGSPAPGATGPAAGPFPPQGSGYDSVDIHVPGLSPRRPSRAGRAVTIGLVAFAILAAGGYGISRYLRLGGPTLPPIAAEVRSAADGGLQLVILVEGAAPGTRVRRGAAEAPVGPDGRATLPLTLDPAEVGTLSLPVEVVPPQGPPRPHMAQVLLAYRVEPDLRMLAEEPAKVHLRFRVPDGAQLFVAGQPVTVAQGVGIAEIPGPSPAPPDPEAPHRSAFPVRVTTAAGRTVEGTYTLRLPRIALRVTEPGRLGVVRGPNAVIAGMAPGAVRVRVGSAEVDVTDGRFRAEIPVAPGSQEVAVVARGPGAAPAEVRVQLLRDVTEAAYLGPNDPGIGALLAPGTPAGQRLSLRGRVLDTRTSDPNTPPTFQLVVTERRCPQGRCVVWVDVPHGTVVATGETVRVVGETAGTRAYTTATNERRSDPVVLALTVTR